MNGQKKRGRPKKKTFNELLREKMARLADEAIERQIPKPVVEPSLDSKDPLQRKKARDKEKQKERHYRYDHSEKGRESQRRRAARWIAKPGKKELKRKSHKAWYEANREREIERTAKWRKEHSGYNAKRLKERRVWIKANDPQKYAEILEREHRYHKKAQKEHPEKYKEYQNKWLAKFKEEHGMSYSTYRYKVKHGLMEEFANDSISP
ncbi:hypothetical protein [Fibrobacter succinogenes]|uniref:hypothetical protein n=1 Tax=Fibrobacter succinogenes TaxID=833 RepID=UPI001569FF49|nr:hypothetical protein [Fibrobacter succinogenes]